MKTTKALQNLLTRAAQDFELDLSGTPVSYRFVDKNSDTITVTIENHTFLRIGEYKDFGDGKLTGDPEFVIFTGAEEWLAVGFTEKGSDSISAAAPTYDDRYRFFIPQIQVAIAGKCEAWVAALMKRNDADSQTDFLIPTWLA